jgi:chaperonin GroES
MQDRTTADLSLPQVNLADPQVAPIKDRVIIRQDPKKERLASGLYLPDTASRELQEDFGTVLAVGPGAVGPGGQRIPMEVAVGDRVLFKRRPSSALIPDEREGGPAEWKDVLVLREEDIIAVIDP